MADGAVLHCNLFPDYSSDLNSVKSIGRNFGEKTGPLGGRVDGARPCFMSFYRRPTLSEFFFNLNFF